MVHSRDSTVVTKHRRISFYRTYSIAFTYCAAAGHLLCQIFHQSKLKRVKLCTWDRRNHRGLIRGSHASIKVLESAEIYHIKIQGP